MAVISAQLQLIYLFLLSLIVTTIFSYSVQSTSDYNLNTNNESSKENFEDKPCNSDQISTSVERKLEEELNSYDSETDCRDCVKRKANFTREELRELRFEVVKKQILQKLHLTEVPCPSKLQPSVRAALQTLEMMNPDDDHPTDEEGSRNESDLDGKAKSILIYPLEDFSPCINAANIPCKRLKFELPSELGLTNPTSATVWLHKKNVQSFLKLSEVVIDENDMDVKVLKDLVVENGELYSRLVKFHLPDSTNWLRFNNLHSILDVQVSCYSGCGTDTESVISEGNDDEKPFFVVHFQKPSVIPRNRRSVDCTEDSIYCCRESLYVSFAEIGWGDWIHAPAGYEANFCMGKCQHDVGSSRFHHSSVLHRYIHMNPEKVEEIGLNMCCSPSKMSHLSIIYSNNGTVIKTTLLNMKVESCDCA